VSGYSAQALPFIHSAQTHKPVPLLPLKNNNVTSNNANSGSVLINCDGDGEKGKSDLYAGGGGGDCELGEGLTGPKPKRNWVELYILLLNWKWFKVWTEGSHLSILWSGLFSKSKIHMFQGLVFCLYLSWLIFSGLGIMRLRLGLPITDVVPSNSSEWEFLTAQVKLFPVYHMRAVTKANFDYPNNQK
jgi:hypothetical protein